MPKSIFKFCFSDVGALAVLSYSDTDCKKLHGS